MKGLTNDFHRNINKLLIFFFNDIEQRQENLSYLFDWLASQGKYMPLQTVDFVMKLY